MLGRRPLLAFLVVDGDVAKNFSISAIDFQHRHPSIDHEELPCHARAA